MYENGESRAQNDDPALWASGGGTFTGTIVANSGQRISLGRLALPSPTMVACQVSIQNTRFGGAIDSGAIFLLEVQWQMGRGQQHAFVDIGRGCSFSLSAAQAVTIDAIVAAGAVGMVVDLESTLAPCTAISPQPATFTSSISLLAGVAASLTDFSSGALNLPAIPTFARALKIVTSSPNNSPAVRVELRANGTTVVDEVNGRNAPIPLGSVPFDTVRLTSPVNCTAWCIWELGL